jgi:hypothetical protein
MGASTRGRAAVIYGLVVLAAASARTAQGAPPGVDDEKESRRLFQKAELGFNLGKFEEALADYQAAYQAKPLPGFLFNIAQCYRNLTDYEHARFFYRRYLALDPRTSNRRLVEELIAEMSGRLDRQAAQSARAAAETPAPTPLPVNQESAAVSGPRAAALGPSPVLVVPAVPSASPRPPVWKRWWFWGGVGTLVAGGAVAAFLLTRDRAGAAGTLPPIDGR